MSTKEVVLAAGLHCILVQLQLGDVLLDHRLEDQ